ncbi:MAG: nucleotide sugar dehydrogenase, partial [Bacteroidales bacterium]|nr:nucleotide sugar dehydrogenase [Bacteroidales bacterium]
ITVCDPWVDADEVRAACGIEVVGSLPDDASFDALMLAVAHRQFASYDVRRLAPQPAVVYDVKGLLPREWVDERL